MTRTGPPFHGKFRGTVASNRDPLMLGRLKVKVKDVYGGETSGWALPCVPYAGKGVGFFMLPPEDAWVWVEFENGNPEYPIWTGCFWSQGQVPASPAVAEMKVIKTDVATITINELPGVGGVTIETKSGAKITLTATGIDIDDGMNGTISLAGPKVSLNGSALEVI